MLQCTLSGHRGTMRLFCCTVQASKTNEHKEEHRGHLWTPQVQSMNWDYQYDSCCACIESAVPWKSWYFLQQNIMYYQKCWSKMWIGRRRLEINPTLCKTCCPRLFQTLMYSGHKQVHERLKQSWTTCFAKCWINLQTSSTDRKSVV